MPIVGDEEKNHLELCYCFITSGEKISFEASKRIAYIVITSLQQPSSCI